MADSSVCTACKEGDIETLRSILSRDIVDINTKDCEGRSLLMLAAEYGNREVFDFLVAKGCDFTIRDKQNRTILHATSTGGNVEITEIVLAQNVIDINCRDQDDKTSVMVASNQGHRDVFFLLVNAGVDLALTDSDGNTVLHHACSGGSREIVEYLLSWESRQVSRINLHGVTPVMTAARYGHAGVFDLLVERECDVTTTDNHDRSLLHMAAQGGNAHIVERILSRDTSALNMKDENRVTPVMVSAYNAKREAFYVFVTQGCSLTGVAKDGDTILHHACRGGSVEIVEYILAQEVIDVDKGGHLGTSPVMKAARHGHKQVFDILVFRNCDLSRTDAKHNSVLHHSVLGGNIDIVKYILSINILNINTPGQSGMTPVMMATLRGHNDVFDLLVRKRCDMFPMCDLGYNVLHIACLSENLKVVEDILSKDMLPATCRGKFDRTPMMLAADQGHKAIFDLFINKGCDFSIVDEEGVNILHIACIGGNLGIVEYIISLGIIDINSRTGRHGRTPVMIAAERNREEIFDFLVRKGSDLSLEDKKGYTVLHSACVGGGLEIVKSILEKNVVDPTKTSKIGDTPIMLAALNHHEDIVKLLETEGCKEEGCVVS